MINQNPKEIINYSPDKATQGVSFYKNTDDIINQNITFTVDAINLYYIR